MCKNFFFISLLFFCTSSFSQETTIEINGYVQLSDETQNLEGAKVIIQDHNNHQNKSYALSDQNGAFSISHTTKSDTFDITVSYIHCITQFQTLIIRQSKIDLDTIVLHPDEKLLNAITVMAKPNPITIKSDTVIYDVASFKTMADANVEQLLEILPGVMVDSDGNITVNGKRVDKILVDGKPFFGSDLTVATRNLSKDMLYTVEISNSRTASEAFTKEEGSLENKTINLILKPDKKRGVFGEITAGAGLDNKYSTNGIFNRFSGNQRISLIGSANNINAPRFSGNNTPQNLDILQITGAKGITKSKNIGINFSDELTEKISITGNYMFIQSTNENSSSFSRETTLPTSSFFSLGNSETTGSNLNHNLNIGIDFKVNPNLLINLRPSFTLTKNDAISFQTQEQLNASLVSANFQEQRSNSNQLNSQFRNNLTITQKIGKNGGVFKFIFANQNSQLTRENRNKSATIIVLNPDANTSRDQLIKNIQKKNYYKTQTSYKIPIHPKTFFLTLGMDYNHTDLWIQQDVDQSLETFEPNVNSDIQMKNKHSDFSPNIELSAKKNKWRASIKSSYLSQTRQLIDYMESNNDNKRVFSGIEITSNVNYQLNNGTNMTGTYQLQNTPPSLFQVQTFPNVINPTNVIIGNPDLESAYNHQITLGLNSFNFKKNRTLFLSSTLDIRKDQIIRKLELDENFFQTTTYANANGGYNLSTNLNYQKRIRFDSLSQLTIDFRANTLLNKRPSLNYGLSSTVTLIVVTPSISASVSRAEWLKLNIEYNLYFTQSSFDVATLETRKVLQHSAGLSANLKFLGHLTWNNSVACNYNPSISDSFQKFYSIWNTGVNYSFKNDKTKLSLKVFDVLNTNRSANREVTSTYVEESNNLVLSRYVMLSLSWKFNKM